MSAVKVGVFFGGMPIENDRKILRESPPHVVVATPGRILALIRGKELNLKNVKHFVLDECDKMLEALDMRRDVQDIFRSTPHEKQVCWRMSCFVKKCRKPRKTPRKPSEPSKSLYEVHYEPCSPL